MSAHRPGAPTLDVPPAYHLAPQHSTLADLAGVLSHVHHPWYNMRMPASSVRILVAVLLLLPCLGYALAVARDPALAGTAWSLLSFSPALAIVCAIGASR
jgi:hypothetical protein